MDKLKYIKLENPDGSYSESIPLSVDSDNVDVNGNTLTSIIETKANIDEVDAGLSILESKIDSAASGSPAGVYDTVSALTTADPDHNKIYVVSADGHWYYYNNNTWADGGVYQAIVDTELQDGSEMAWDILSKYEENYIPSLSKGSTYSTSTGAIIDNRPKRARTNRISIVNRGDIVTLNSNIYEMDIFYYSSYSEELTDCFISSPGIWRNQFWASKIGTHYTLVFRRKDEANITDNDITAIQASLHFYRLTDQNLTIKNAPADAKIVGDKINALKNQIGDVITGIDSQYPIESSDFIVGSYYSSNNGTIQDDSTGIYARLPKQWLNGVTALKLNADYVIRAIYYGESGAFLNKYSGEYSRYIQIDSDDTIKQIGINVRRLDSTPLSSTDIVTITESLKFFTAADNTLNIKNVPAESITVGTEKVSNDSFVVIPNLYSESTYSYNGINYTSKMWHHGYLANEGSGYSGSFVYITLLHGLDYVKGSTPSAIKVKIKDTSILNYPYIRVGWYDDTTNIILATIKGEQEVVIPVPTYPNAADTTGGLVVTIGRFSTDAMTTEEIQYRINEWADENVEITCLYEPVYKDRGITHIMRGSAHENDYLYNSEFQYALKLPQNYTAYTEQKTPLVILCHGLSSTIDENMWGSNADMIKLVKVFTSQGYAVMDVQRVTSADWCNPALVRKYKKAIDYIVKHYNVEVKYIYAESMGCLISLALQQTYDIKAMIITGLRLDFEDRYSKLTENAKAIVDTNLGLTNGWDKNIVAMYCPTLCEVLDSDGEKVNYKTFPPTLYMEGTEDTANETSEAKIIAIQRGGSIAKLSSYPGDHHTVCYLLGTGMAEEALAWFDDYK